jgi:transcription antitermination factor NusG
VVQFLQDAGALSKEARKQARRSFKEYDAGPLRLVFKKYGLIAKNVAPNKRRLKNQADVAKAAGVSGGAKAPKKTGGDIVVGSTVIVQKGLWKGHAAKVIRITIEGKIKVRLSANGASHEYAKRSLVLAADE